MEGQLFILLVFVAGLVIGSAYTNHLRDRVEAMMFDDPGDDDDGDDDEGEDDDDPADDWKKGRKHWNNE